MKEEGRRLKDEGGTLVCFAVKEEAAPFQKIAAGKSGVFILITGIGQRNSGRSIREFLRQHSPARVFTCGFAGGLNSDLAIGDVVFLTVEPELDKLLVEAGARPAKFFCSPRVAVTAVQKRELRQKTGADAVEMESLTIHDACRERQIPCATVRAISDTAEEDLPLDFNRLLTPDQELSFGRLAGELVRSPAKIGGLLQLRKNTAAAAAALARTLRAVIFR